MPFVMKGTGLAVDMLTCTLIIPHIKAKRPNSSWDAWYIWGVSWFRVGTKNPDVRSL